MDKMEFTDEDLERFETLIQRDAEPPREYDAMETRCLMVAYRRRLECAERCAEELKRYWNKDTRGEHDGAHSVLNPWLASCGKVVL